MSKDSQIQAMLGQLSPEVQAIAKDYARVKLEAKMAQAGLKECNAKYMNLYLYFLAILRNMPDRAISFRSEELEALATFGEHWQIESFHEEVDGVGHQIVRLAAKGGDKPDAADPKETKDA